MTENDKQAFVVLHKMLEKERCEMTCEIISSRSFKEEEAEFNAFYCTFTTFCKQHDLNQEAEIAETIL